MTDTTPTEHVVHHARRTKAGIAVVVVLAVAVGAWVLWGERITGMCLGLDSCSFLGEPVAPSAGGQEGELNTPGAMEVPAASALPTLPPPPPAPVDGLDGASDAS